MTSEARSPYTETLLETIACHLIGYDAEEASANGDARRASATTPLEHDPYFEAHAIHCSNKYLRSIDESEDTAAVEGLMGDLPSISDPFVRNVIFHYIGSVDQAANAASPLLIEMLNESLSDLEFKAVAKALCHIGTVDETVRAFCKLLLPRTERDSIRRICLEALRDLGVAANDGLVYALIQFWYLGADDDELIISCLSSIGPPKAAHLKLLTDILTAPELTNNPVIVSYATQYIGALGSQANIAAPLLIKVLWELGDKFPDTQKHVSYALQSVLEVGVTECVPGLLELLNEQDEFLRRMAAFTLVQIEQAPVDTVPVFVEILANSKVDNLREQAVKALGHLGPVAVDAVPTLIDLLSELEDDGLRRCAAEALGAIGPAAKDALPYLIIMLDEGQNRQVAITALRGIGPIARQALAERRQIHTSGGQADASNGPKDFEAAAILNSLKLFYLIGKLYSEGAISRNAASRILDLPGVKKAPDDNLSTSPATIKRAIQRDLIPFFRKRFNKPLTLFEEDKDGGKASRFTVEGEQAWRWTEKYLRGLLGADWFGFARRLTPNDY